MRKKLTLLLVAIMALPSLCAASDAIKDDSVKVIKNPEQVTITKRDGMFRLNVDGNDQDKDYRYEYLVKERYDGKLYVQESEGGNVKFRGAGKYKLHFEVSNVPGNIAEGRSEPDRPAVLGETTHDYFYYENVNECGYGFSAHFFKKFVVLKTTTGRETLDCFGMGAAFDGVYIKVKQ